MVGLGSAFAQMMQGDMAAQRMNQRQEQSGRQQEQSDRQQEQFDMLQTQFNQGQQALAKQAGNEAVYAAEHGDWSMFQNISEQFPDQFGGGEVVRAVNDSDYMSQAPDGVPGLDGQVRNKFLSDTGSPLPDDDQEAIDILKRSGYIEGAAGEGEAFVTADQLGRGMGTGFREFKKQKLMEEYTLMAKLQGKEAEQKPEARMSELLAKTRVEGFGSLTDEEKADFDVFSQKTGMTKQNAQEVLTNPASFDDSLATVTKDSWSPMDVNQNDLFAMDRIEQKGGYEDKNVDDYRGQITSISGLTDVRNLAIDLKGEIASGKMENFSAKLAKMAGDEDLATMKQEEFNKLMNTVDLQSQIGTVGASFLKALSGSAVSEEEYQRIMNNLLGGDITENNIDAVIAALGGSSSRIYEDMKTNIQGMSDTRTPASKVKLGQDLERAYNPTAYTPEQPTEGTTISDVAATVPADQMEQGLGQVTQVVEPIVEDIGNWADNTWLGTKFKSIKNQFNNLGFSKPSDVEAVSQENGVSVEATSEYIKRNNVSKSEVTTSAGKAQLKNYANNRNAQDDSTIRTQLRGFDTLADLEAAIPGMSDAAQNFYEANKNTFLVYYTDKNMWN